MKTVKNEQTGEVEIQLAVKLLDVVSAKPLENKNGKKYKLVNIEFADKSGKPVQTSAACYEGNYSKGIETGKTYLATARKTEDNKVYIQMSHLPQGANLATAEMFPDFVVEKATVLATR